MGHLVKLGHIAIKTADLGKTLAFYETLGGVVRAREDLGPVSLIMLKLADFELEIVYQPEAAKAEGSIPHFAVIVDDVKKTIEDLKASGIDSFRGEMGTMDIFGGMDNVFLEGPNGEVIELMKMHNI